jgi:cytoskeleton protein RodZ
METIGSILKEAREKQNKNIDDIVETTKISRANIAAIEAENFDFCPGHAYTRAFIKIYAEELLLDAEELAVMYDQKIPGKNRLDDKVKPVSEIGLFTFLRDKKTILVAITGFVVVSLFFFGYEKQDVGKINQDLPVEAEINPETNSSSTTEMKVEKEPVVNNGSISVSELSTIEKDNVVEEVSLEGNPASSGVEERDVLAQPETFVLRFVARDLTWLKIVADDEVSEIMLRAGESHTKRAVKSMRVRIGNSGGVSLFYNDIPLGSPGKPGEPVDIQFPEAAKNLKAFE